MSVSKPTGTNTGLGRAVTAKPQWRHESGLTRGTLPLLPGKVSWTQMADGQTDGHTASRMSCSVGHCVLQKRSHKRVTFKALTNSTYINPDPIFSRWCGNMGNIQRIHNRPWGI